MKEWWIRFAAVIGVSFTEIVGDFFGGWEFWFERIDNAENSDLFGKKMKEIQKKKMQRLFLFFFPFNFEFFFFWFFNFIIFLFV